MVIPSSNPSPKHEQKTAVKPRPQPVYCVIGDTLCEVRVWSEAEWDQLDPAARPSKAVYVDGLGWVGAVLGPIPD